VFDFVSLSVPDPNCYVSVRKSQRFLSDLFLTIISILYFSINVLCFDLTHDLVEYGIDVGEIHCCGSGFGSVGTLCFWALRIRFRILYFFTSFLLSILSLKADVNVH
jgi:hypothetical protein